MAMRKFDEPVYCIWVKGYHRHSCWGIASVETSKSGAIKRVKIWEKMFGDGKVRSKVYFPGKEV